MLEVCIQIVLADYPPGQRARALRLLEADEKACRAARSAQSYLDAAYIEDSPYDVEWRRERRR